MIRKFINIFSFVILSLNSNCYSQILTEGQIKFVNYDINFDKITKKDTIGHTEYTNIWFRDSSVIFEFRINSQSEERNEKGDEVIKNSYPVWKYTFLDLKTMKCQDYFDFKDTSSPLSNYQIKYTDTSNLLSFFRSKHELDTLHGVYKLNDTIINKKLFSRVKILYKYYTFQNIYFIYYFDCNAKKNIFHFNKTLGDMMPSCKATIIDTNDSLGHTFRRTELKIIKEELTTEEKSIFDQWQKNAKKTLLPLISFRESYNISIPPHEHENPKIKIIPYEKKH